HPKHRFLSYLSQQRNVMKYFAVCLIVSTVAYSLLGFALSTVSTFIATSLPLFAVAYQAINFQQEVDFILRRAGNISGIVIDVACGSGGHAELLSKAGFDVYAVDVNAGMLRLLKKNLPNAKVFRQDMRQLRVPVQADVLICMYNSINYNYSHAELANTLQRFYDQLKPGGVVIFDTAFMTHTWKPGPFSVETTTTPEFEVARVNKSYKKGAFGIVDIVFVIFEKGRKKVVETQNKIFLPDRKRIVEL